MIFLRKFIEPFLLKSHALIRSLFSRKTLVIRNVFILLSLINIVLFDLIEIVIVFHMISILCCYGCVLPSPLATSFDQLYHWYCKQSQVFFLAFFRIPIFDL